MEDIRDRRITVSLTLPTSTVNFLEAVARERFGMNRTAAAEHYLELGRAAEAAGWRPEHATVQAQG